MGKEIKFAHGETVSPNFPYFFYGGFNSNCDMEIAIFSTLQFGYFKTV
jgi:hypothetical protein